MRVDSTGQDLGDDFRVIFEILQNEGNEETKDNEIGIV